MKREHSYTVGGNINRGNHCGKQYGGFSKKKKIIIELPHDPAILGIYLEKTIIGKLHEPPYSVQHYLQ